VFEPFFAFKNNMEAPTEEQKNDIIDSINTLDTDVRNIDDAKEFLLKIDLEKDSISRLFAYLMTLGIIKGQEGHIGEEIEDLIENYAKQTNELLGNNFETPLKAINKNNAAVIKTDIKRSLFWFENSCELLKIDKFYQKNVKEVVHRMLAMLELYNKKLTYIQGFDRFAFLSYCLSLSLIIKASIPVRYAEAVAFFLSEKLIILANSATILDDPLNYHVFGKIDERLKTIAPETTKVLEKTNEFAFQYAMRWRLILFCDEHNAKATLLLWDNFVLHREKVDEFFIAAACAHVKQVPVDDCLSMVERIQGFRKWDDEMLVKSAREIDREGYEKQKERVTSKKKRIYFLIALSAIAFAVAIHIYMKKQ
jgi:predicted PolB exonuclease-like 3'-5' exonuclease